MAKILHRWHCPGKKVFFLKVEVVLLAVLVFLVFVFSFGIFQRWWLAAGMSLFFILVFFGLVYLFRKVYPIKEIYQLTQKGISIEKRMKNKVTKIFISYPEIKNFKLDKFWEGGRLETKKQRHPLYFNTKKEIEKLEKILKRKIKRS